MTSAPWLTSPLRHERFGTYSPLTAPFSDLGMTRALSPMSLYQPFQFTLTVCNKMFTYFAF